MISFKVLARVGEVINASRVTIIGINDDTLQADRGQVILEVTGWCHAWGHSGFSRSHEAVHRCLDVWRAGSKNMLKLISERASNLYAIFHITATYH